ncbi:response regulator [Chelatococcus sp. SYSU_G07232]|uniref:Response regulator n=1 Tax=Chelatococcus albus TaxID=3047466 RepID=A0ABT7AGP2_9HYPH|nr:response regulator [Chelatococcus sp. SYSU_G07232]MDJ1158532.1 response regulator [Chelatococcus sp. SYSU_G07232]
MSLPQQIAPHLPYLRRFARALSGSQSSGDAYVVATLEALVAEPAIFPADVDPKIGLYRIFLSLWNTVALNQRETPETALPAAPERNLEAITPRPRQAFLLRTVEGFSLDETALVLGASTDETRALLDEAGREIADQVATDVLIIEDEPVIAMDIEILVAELGHHVVDVARTHKEAVEAARQHRPGLVLADIQLADGSSGLDAVNELIESLPIPVIFITAYPERLLTGKRPEPAFLITKPFQADTVKAAISQALFFDRRARRSAA